MSLNEQFEPVEETAEILSEEPAAEEVTETLAEEPAAEEAEPIAEEPAKKKSPVTAIILAVLAVFLCVAAVFAVKHFKTNASVTTAVELTEAHHTNAHGYPSWSVHFHTHEGETNLHYSYLNENAEEISLTADEVNTLLNEQVATCGKMTLDNRTLQYYYNDSLNTLYNQYYSYISYMLDTAAPLDSQMNYATGDGTSTWQENLLENSLTAFYSSAALVQEANKEGFTIPEDERAYLDSSLDFEMMAQMYGYPDGNTLIKDILGPMATVESYRQYAEHMTLANSYMKALSDSVEITDEEIDSYYSANQSVFTGQNIQKIDENVINVRHILIQPEAAEDGTISDEAWTAAETEAQRILDEWSAGEATESSFGELAGTYSTDPGSASMGGLYENVYPNQMVTEFNDWCFDDARQPGDTGIVKTSYGYHIMFYVSEGDYIYWKEYCRQSLLNEKVSDMCNTIAENYKSAADTSKIILLDASEATVPTTETAE